MRHVPVAVLSVLLPALLAAPAAGQQDGKPPPKPAAKLEQWPPLADLARDKAIGLVAQFRKDAHLHADARTALVALGDQVVPLLFSLVSDRADNVNEQLFSVFDQLLGPQHSALLAREHKNSRAALRRYVALRLCKLVEPPLQPVLEAMCKDKDAEVVFLANVGLLALRQQSALQPVLQRVRSDWSGCRELLAAVLPAARARTSGQWLLDLAAKATAVEQMNALRLLRWLGTKDHALAIKAYLAAEDNNVKKEAINALRVIHGEEPLENLPVFQVIGLAKEWQNK